MRWFNCVMPRWAATLVASAVGCFFGVVTYGRLADFNVDITYAQRAAQHLLAGRDPYAQMPLGTLLYPLPAAFVAIPLAAMDVRMGGTLFVGVSAATMAYACARRAVWALLALTSPPFLLSVWACQWPPLMAAAALLPSLGWLGVAKPNLGLVVFAYRPQRSTLVGGSVLLLASFTAVPSWPLGWMTHLRAQETAHLPAVLWPLGFVGLVGLLRWRQPEGRLLAAMTLVPATSVAYDYLLLWLIPRRAHEAIALTITSWLAVLAIYATVPNDLTRSWTLAHLFTSLGLIAPAAWMVWRRRT